MRFLLAISILFYSVYALEIKEGWNLVGTTNDFFPGSDTILSDSTKTESVWRYDDLNWKSYTPTPSVNTLIKLEKGYGFWLHSKANYTSPFSTQSSEDSFTLDLDAGWNMVAAKNGKSFDPNSIGVLNVWVFRDNNWISLNSGTLTSIEAGEGVFVYSESKKQVIINTSQNQTTQAPPSMPAVISSSSSSYGNTYNSSSSSSSSSSSYGYTYSSSSSSYGYYYNGYDDDSYEYNNYYDDDRYEYNNGYDDDSYEYNERDGVAPISNQTYINKCTKCHFGYQPGLLPSSSWDIILSNLSNHHGKVNVNVDSATLQTLSTYIKSNSAENALNYERSRKIMESLRYGEIPTKVSTMSYMQEKHRKISSYVMSQSGLKNISNCKACHTVADNGIYDDDFIVIPNVGRWYD